MGCNEPNEIHSKFVTLLSKIDRAIKATEYFLNDLENNGLSLSEWKSYKIYNGQYLKETYTMKSREKYLILGLESLLKHLNEKRNYFKKTIGEQGFAQYIEETRKFRHMPISKLSFWFDEFDWGNRQKVLWYLIHDIEFFHWKL